ncbi:MAG: hypothetical protein Kow00108_03750 [Calditrichia bacterium]
MQSEFIAFTFLSFNDVNLEKSPVFHIRPDVDWSRLAKACFPLLTTKWDGSFISLFGKQLWLDQKSSSHIPVIMWNHAREQGLYEAIKKLHAIEPFTVIEQILIIHYLMKEHSCTPESITKNLKEFSIPINHKFLKLYNEVQALPHFEKTYLALTRASLKQIKQYISYPENIRRLAADLLDNLYVKIKHLLEIFDYLVSCGPIDSSTLAELTNLIKPHAEEPTPHAIHKIKRELMLKAKPQLLARKSAIDQIVTELELKGISVSYDDQFEEKSVHVQLKINSVQEFEKIINTLQNDEIRTMLKKILSIIA